MGNETGCEKDADVVGSSCNYFATTLAKIFIILNYVKIKRIFGKP